MAYTNVFGGQPQNPSQVSMVSYSITGAINLEWPWSGTPSNYIMAKIVRISADDAFYGVYVPVADIASNGEATIFINTGAHVFDINDSTGANITSVLPGIAKYVYLIDNSTAAGSWGVFTFGSGSSGADASTLAGAGLQAIANTLNEELVVVDLSSSGFNLTSASRAILYNWTGGSDTITTDDANQLGTAWFAMIRNSGSGTLAITPASGTIDGASSKNFQPGDTGYLIRDGGDLITLGFGQSAAFSFDYISINVAGSGTLVLNAAQQNRIAYKFTGLLTGNRGIEVPATVQQYWVTNATTGAFTLGLWTNAQGTPGVEVVQGDANILYCNGSEVVPGVSSTGVSLPVSIANGGTGATNSSGALTNLGGTATGVALFTAASASAARSTLALGNLATLNTVGTSQIDDAAVTTNKIADSNVTTAKINNNAVTFAKMQAITDGKLLGASGGTAVEEITVGTGLVLSSNTLSATIGVLYNYISITMSNNVTTPDTKIDVSAGTVADSTNAEMFNFAGGTLNLATTGANGLRTGSLAANTNYAVFLIKGTSGVATFADTSLTPGTRPAGYTTSYRRIGTFRTDASAHVLAFKQIGRTFQMVNPIVDVVGGATTGVANTLNLFTLASMMTGKKWPVQLLAVVASTTNSQRGVTIADPDQAAQNADNSPPFGDTVSPGNSMTPNFVAMHKILFTDTSSRVAVRTAVVQVEVTLSPLTWEDDGL